MSIRFRPYLLWMFCSCEVHFPQVAVGGQFSQVLLNNPRKLWTCGPRETGALGRHFDHDDDDDDHELQLVEIPGNEDVVRVCSGDTFAVAVVGDGGMFLWGSVRPGFDVKATLDGFNIQYRHQVFHRFRIKIEGVLSISNKRSHLVNLEFVNCLN